MAEEGLTGGEEHGGRAELLDGGLGEYAGRGGVAEGSEAGLGDAARPRVLRTNQLAAAGRVLRDSRRGSGLSLPRCILEI